MKHWKKISVFIQAALIAFAVQREPVNALNRWEYKSVTHYLYAQATNLLGEYSFKGLLLFALAVVFVLWMRRGGFDKRYDRRLLPVFFSFCLLTGQNYAAGGSWKGCFGDVFITAGFLAALAGYAILFRYLTALFLAGYQRIVNSQWSSGWAERFFGEKCFRHVFLLLMILWAPVLLLSFPGNLCYDSLGQIEQSMGLHPYSAHHPLLHTLILGGAVRLGKLLTGSNDPGLFVYLLLQAAALAAALAGTVSRLARRGASPAVRLAVTGVYVLAPMYSNMASTVIKDIPFTAAVIWYLLLLEELDAGGIEGRKPLFWIRFILVQALVGFLRNNGIYIIVLSGLAAALVWGKAASVRKKLSLLLCMTALPLLLYSAGNGILARALSAEKGSVAEMLSIPFQQTARYLQLYREELTREEREAVERVLADVDKVAECYNPDISDPVKALYRKDTSIGGLAAYFRVWAAGLFRHPETYMDAFMIHVYGWFDPGVTNAIRYEAFSDLFECRGLFEGADKILIFLYRFAEYIPPLALLENVGVYTWLLFLLGGEAFRERKRRGILLAPLFVSLLICMAAPCFYLHPRYAYPIMFTVPFLYGVMYRPKA